LCTPLPAEVKITKPQPKLNTAIRTGKISKKEGKLLAKKNGNMKSWLVKSKQLHLSSIQEEEDDPFSMMEVDKTMDWT
jgi:hypothetical protein